MTPWVPWRILEFNNNDLTHTWVQSLPPWNTLPLWDDIEKNITPWHFSYEIKGPDVIFSDLCLFVYVPEYRTCTIDFQPAVTQYFLKPSWPWIIWVAHGKVPWTFNQHITIQAERRGMQKMWGQHPRSVVNSFLNIFFITKLIRRETSN